MKKVIIHVGLAKTGTTAVQQALCQQQRELADRGVWVLKAGRHENGHHGIYWKLRSDPKAEIHCPSFELDEVVQEVRDKSNYDLVISSEGFSTFAFQPTLLHALCKLFPGRQTVGIVYVREQLEFFNSFYSQIVMAVDTCEEIEKFIRRMTAERRYHYSFWLKPLHDTFDKLIVRPYTRQMLAGGDVVDDFFDVIELNDSVPPAEGRFVANVAVSAREVELGLRVRQALDSLGINPDSIGLRIWTKIRAHVRSSTLKLIRGEPAGGSYWGVEPELADWVRSQFTCSNAEFAKEYSLGAELWTNVTPRELNIARIEDLGEEDRFWVRNVVREALQIACGST